LLTSNQQKFYSVKQFSKIILIIKKRIMFKNFKASEILIIIVVIIVIFVSEYLFLVVGDKDKAIFIGLWPPTILGLLNFINSKLKK